LQATTALRSCKKSNFAVQIHDRRNRETCQFRKDKILIESKMLTIAIG